MISQVTKNIVLNNNLKMPIIGFGTYPLMGDELVSAVKLALKYGYRSFDTSISYKNEESLGLALKNSGIPRKDIFITTKIGNKEQRSKNIRAAFESSLEKLKTDYIDLYLMHWPNPETYLDTWKAMEEIYREGLAKSIGVSNFHEHHIKKLLTVAEIIPAVNQVEIHPLLSQVPLRTFCAEYKIQMEAYSPLARMHSELIHSPTLVSLAKKYQKTIPQIVLRWHYEKNLIFIPSSKNENRIKENINILDFTIAREDIQLIDSMNKGLRARYNPDTCDYAKL